MGSLMGLMALSTTALNADQTAINTTANNVANQNTPGYTREVVSFNATDAVTLNGAEGMGQGVSATVSSVRDRVLQQMLQQQTQASAQGSAVQTALENVQSLFGLSSSSTNASGTAVGSALNGFFASLTSLSANPTNAATQAGVLSAAQTLAAAFNNTAQGLNQQTAQLNQEIGSAAGQINGITASIAQLNQQITSLSPNADAGTLEDQRQQDVLQLSALLGVNQIKTESDGLTVTTSNGAVLVGGTKAYAVSTTTVQGNTELVAGDPATAMGAVQGGSIGGMMQVRDGEIPSVLGSLDQLAYAVGTAVNAQNEAGTTPTGVAGGAIFGLPSGSLPSASLSSAAAGSAQAITVVATGSSAIATAGAGEGASGTTNALALAGLSSTALVNGQTATDNFAGLIGTVGDAVTSATSQATAATASLTQVQTQVSTLSGVSLDSEASSLSEYQRSYEAAAKLLTIVDQVLLDAINIGVQTAAT